MAKNGKKPARKQLAKRKRKGPVYHIPFPIRRNVTFKYTMYDNLTASSAGTSSQVINLNSLYDPDSSGVGAQPRFYDELVSATMYSRYQVQRVGYNVTFVNKATNDCIVGLALRDSSFTSPTTPGGLWDLREHRHTFVKTCLAQGSGKNRVIMKGTIEPHKLLSMSKAAYKAQYDTTGALYNANPTNLCKLIAIASDNPQDASTCNVDVFITLYFNSTVFNFQDNAAQS